MILEQSVILEKYELSNKSTISEKLEYRVIIRLYKNKVIQCIGKHKINEAHNTTDTQESSFSKEVLKAIEEHTAVAGVDALVKKNYVGATWILCDNNNKHYEIGSIQTSK